MPRISNAPLSRPTPGSTCTSQPLLPAIPTIVRGLFVLGGDDWRRDGMLHHKFVAVDPGVVWVGSYNFTTFARNNYESLVRIADAAVAARFVDETLDLVRETTTPNQD